MDILEMFYNRVYENNINFDMLDYDYSFPIDDMLSYVRQFLAVPVLQFVQYDLDKQIADPIMPQDVFQFSSLEMGTYIICRKLADIGNPGVTHVQAGKLLLDDGKTRNDMAYRKYGENHLKTAELLGLIFNLSHTYFMSCMGTAYLELNHEEQQNLLVRLLLRSKIISRFIKETKCGTVNARQFLYMLSDTTYARRKSNLKCLFECLKESREYDFLPIIRKIYFP